MRILRERRVAATVYAVGMALERNPDAVAEIAESGFESPATAALDRLPVRREDAERADMPAQRRGQSRAHRPKTARLVHRPAGPNTRRLVVETGGFLYDSDAYNRRSAYGSGSAAVPISWFPHIRLQRSRLQRGATSPPARISSPIAAMLSNAISMGNEGRPRMMTVSLHASHHRASGRNPAPLFAARSHAAP